MGAASVLRRLARALKRLDPCRDPEAERVSGAFLVTFALAAAFSCFILFRYTYEPGRDVGYHAFCVRILSERSNPASFFHDRYAPLHLLYPNTLFYAVAALLGKIVEPFAAFRIVRLEYFLGLPLVTLYALRRLGRSPWGALLVFPMEYSQAYAAGFVNFSFAAPLLIAALLAYWLFTEQATVRRGLAVALLCVLTFLAHAHVYLWLGALLGPITLYGAVRELAGPSPDDVRTRVIATGKRLLYSLGCALPSLLLFARWAARYYGAHPPPPPAGSPPPPIAPGLHWLSIDLKMIEAQWGPKVTKHTHESWWMIGTAVLIMVALVLAQREKRRSAPVFELCGILTVASYFFLPDDLGGQQIARRSWDMASWMVPFFVTPVMPAASRWARGAIIAGIIAFSFGRLRDIQMMVWRFNSDELAGFDAMVAAAPKEDLFVAWAASDFDSPNVIWLPWAQWNQMFAARTGLEAPLYYTNADSSTPVSYVTGPPAPPMLMIAEPGWGSHPGLWDHYDLVLSKGWHPDPAQLAAVRANATLLAESHEWQLWRRIGPAPRPMDPKGAPARR